MLLDGGFSEGKLSRRAFLAAAASTPLLMPIDSRAQAMGREFWALPRWVWMRHYKTGEEIRSTYFANGQLIQSEYEKICWFMRDRNVNKGMYMSPILLDVLYAQCGWVSAYGIERPFMFTSGARFAETNDKTEGAVKDSRHMKGEAVDGFFQGVPVQKLRDFVIWIGGGGIGYYPTRNFVHTDVGPRRLWRG